MCHGERAVWWTRACVHVLSSGGGAEEVIKIAMKVTIGVINTVVLGGSAALKVSHYFCC